MGGGRFECVFFFVGQVPNVPNVPNVTKNVTNLASFLALTLVPCSPDFCFLILERMCLMVHVPTTMD